jgi:hypothetical protein
MENKNHKPFRAVNLLTIAPYYLLNKRRVIHETHISYNDVAEGNRPTFHTNSSCACSVTNTKWAHRGHDCSKTNYSISEHIRNELVISKHQTVNKTTIKQIYSAIVKATYNAISNNLIVSH